MIGMGESRARTLARSLLEAYIQSPAPGMVEAYARRLALYPADVAVPGINRLMDVSDGRPSIPAMLQALSGAAGSALGSRTDYPAGMDPEAEWYELNGRTYARMPRHKRDTYLAPRYPESDPYHDLPREEQIRLLERGVEFFRKHMPKNPLAQSIIASAEGRLEDLRECRA